MMEKTKPYCEIFFQRRMTNTDMINFGLAELIRYLSNQGMQMAEDLLKFAHEEVLSQ